MSEQEQGAVSGGRTWTPQMRADLVRLSVNLNEETAMALKDIADRHGISFTEAIRRVIAVYKYLDDEQAAGRVIQIVDPKKRKVWELGLL
jgi:hypothetical protein